MDPQERFYYPGLDALRGIAIILVILFHYFLFFRIGWIGVDLFFVLSGFLITSILLRERDSNFYFRNFYLRRILRIFPLYYLVLVVFFLAAPIVFVQKDPSSTYGYYKENYMWFWFFFQNWLFIKKGTPPEPYLIHFWSLAIEEQFYLVWPFIVFFVRKIKTLKQVVTALFLIALVLRIVFIYSNSSALENNYYNSFCRMDSLAAGGFLAITVYQGRVIPKIGLYLSSICFIILLGCSWFLYHDFSAKNPAFATVGYSIIAIFCMFLCYGGVLHENSFFGRMSALRFVGRISYGLYVFHLPVYLVLSSLLNPRVNSIIKAEIIAHAVTAIICIAATFIISFVSYKLFELPLLRLRNKFH